MIQLSPQHRVCLYVAPLDFRCGIDSLVGRCRRLFGQDPFSGYLFVFTNRRRTGIKILVYDGSGFWCCHKRFSSGRLRWWPETDGGIQLNFPVHELQAIIMNAIPDRTMKAPFRQVLQP